MEFGDSLKINEEESIYVEVSCEVGSVFLFKQPVLLYKRKHQ